MLINIQCLDFLICIMVYLQHQYGSLNGLVMWFRAMQEMQTLRRNSHNGKFSWPDLDCIPISSPHSPVLPSNMPLFLILFHNFLITSHSNFLYRVILHQMGISGPMQTLNSKHLMFSSSPFVSNTSQFPLMMVGIHGTTFTGKSPHYKFP